MSEKDENQDKSFNDAELQDIMNEIESLEREFVEEEAETIAEKKEETSTEVGPEAVAQEETEVVAQEDTDSVAEDDNDINEEAEAQSLVNEVADDFEENIVPMSKPKAKRASPKP